MQVKACPSGLSENRRAGIWIGLVNENIEKGYTIGFLSFVRELQVGMKSVELFEEQRDMFRRRENRKSVVDIAKVMQGAATVLFKGKGLQIAYKNISKRWPQGAAHSYPVTLEVEFIVETELDVLSADEYKGFQSLEADG